MSRCAYREKKTEGRSSRTKVEKKKRYKEGRVVCHGEMEQRRKKMR